MYKDNPLKEISMIFLVSCCFLLFFDSRILFSIITLEFSLFFISLSIIEGGMSYTPIALMMMSASILCVVLSFVCLSLRSFSSGMMML